MRTFFLPAIAILGLVITVAGCGTKPGECGQSPVAPSCGPAEFRITAVFPPSGPADSAVPAQVAGSGFLAGATVTFDGVAMTDVVTTGTLIKGTAPPHAAGSVDVVVTNPGGRTATLSRGFAYVPFEVTSVSPSADLPGIMATVYGMSFQIGAVLTFDGLNAVIVGSGPTWIRAQVPAHAPGLVDVVVTNPNGSFRTLTGGYRYAFVEFSTSASQTTPGAPLTVSWVAPPNRSEFDWIGLFELGQPSSSYEEGWWQYTKGVASGSLTLTAPAKPGVYEFRYFADDGLILAGRSNPVGILAPVLAAARAHAFSASANVPAYAAPDLDTRSIRSLPPVR